MEEKDLGKTSTGIKPNVEALLCYSLGWVSGLIFYLLEKENKFVRFHAFQSMVVFGALTVVSMVLPMVPMFGWVLFPLVSLLQFGLWILLMIKAYQGEKIMLPVAGDVAEKNS